MARWTESHIPELTGKRIVVTGGNTGLGFQTARALAHKGADVVIACRSKDRAEGAVEALQAHEPAGNVSWAPLDLADLDSVAAYPYQDTDVLINNAGVMIPPRSITPSGWESQFGINVVGHFALTMRMMDHMNEGGRIVTLSSVAHRAGRIDFDNLRGEKTYRASREYCQSKLADLMMALELDRRLRARGSDLVSVASHPGVSRTELARSRAWADLGMLFVSQSAKRGALPTLYAATTDAPGGSYWGPRGLGEYWGHPHHARISRRAQDEDVARKLWTVLEDATGLSYP